MVLRDYLIIFPLTYRNQDFSRNVVSLYQSLRTDDDSGFLREEFDTLHIRPCPPETLVVDRFSLFEEVDALYNDGWWVGVISKVLGGSKYLVYFRDTDEEIEFKHSDLRPHQDWIDGKWIMASQV